MRITDAYGEIVITVIEGWYNEPFYTKFDTNFLEKGKPYTAKAVFTSDKDEETSEVIEFRV